MLVSVLACAVAAEAQEKPAGPGSAPPSVTRPLPSFGVNVRFEIVITEQGGDLPQTQRSISLVVSENNTGSTRNISAPGPAAEEKRPPGSLNVDVGGRERVTVLPEGTVRASVSVDYQPFTPGGNNSLFNQVRGVTTAVFQSGKALTLAQTVDPTGDRRTTIEVTATILK